MKLYLGWFMVGLLLLSFGLGALVGCGCGTNEPAYLALYAGGVLSGLMLLGIMYELGRGSVS